MVVIRFCAGVAKLADAPALEADASNGMQVQVLSPAHTDYPQALT